MANGMTYDVAVIGGGVVGCAVLRELKNQGLHCILCEAEPELLSHASSGIAVHIFVHNNLLSSRCLYLYASLKYNIANLGQG